MVPHKQIYVSLGNSIDRPWCINSMLHAAPFTTLSLRLYGHNLISNDIMARMRMLYRLPSNICDRQEIVVVIKYKITFSCLLTTHHLMTTQYNSRIVYVRCSLIKTLLLTNIAYIYHSFTSRNIRHCHQKWWNIQLVPNKYAQIVNRNNFLSAVYIKISNIQFSFFVYTVPLWLPCRKWSNIM